MFYKNIKTILGFLKKHKSFWQYLTLVFGLLLTMRALKISIPPLTNLLTIFGIILLIILLIKKYQLIKKTIHTHAVKISVVASGIFLLIFAYFLARELMLTLGIDQPIINKLFSYIKIPVALFTLSVISLYILPDRKEGSPLVVKLRLIIRHKKAPLIILATLVLVGFAMRAYQLGNKDIVGDEFQVIGAATGYLNTGDYYRWDWINNKPSCLKKTNACYYDRAWPHTWMIAQTYRIAGISETTSRIPSLIWGTLLIILSYPIALYFTGSKVSALSVAGLVALGSSFIGLSRYTRMYVVLQPLFLLLLYTSYRTVSESYLPKKIVNRFTFLKKIEKLLPIHWGYALVSLFLLYWNYHVHLNSLIIAPIVLLFVLAIYLIDPAQRRRLRLLAPLALVALVGFFLIVFSGIRFSHFISFFERRNYLYFDHIFSFPFSTQLTTTLVGLATLSAVIKKQKKLIFLGISLLFTLIWFIYVADRYSAFVYTSHLVVISTIMSIIGLKELFKKMPKIFTISSLLIFSLYLLISKAHTSFERYHHQGGAQHSVAYQVIVDNYDVDKYTLLLQYPRTYYLRSLDQANIISMLSHGHYSYEEFIEDTLKAKQGWIAWETGKSYHIRDDIREFINDNFEKLHGAGIDDTGVELYWFDVDAIK